MLVRAEGEIRRSSNPWVALEMTALRMASAPNIVDLSKVISSMDSRIEALPKSDKSGGITATPEKETNRIRTKKGIDIDWKGRLEEKQLKGKR